LDTGFGEKIIKQVFDKFKLNLLETNQLFSAHTQLDAWFSISAKLSPNTNYALQ